MIERNQKVLKISIAAIVTTAILCMVFIFLFRLDEPVFLKHYYEYPLPTYSEEWQESNQTSFILQYVTNVDDTSYITDISFEEEPKLYFQCSYDRDFNFIGEPFDDDSYNIDQGSPLGRYVIKTVFLALEAEENAPYQNKKSIELNRAKIRFQDGTSMDADIGRIILYQDSEGEQILQGIGGTTSSDGIVVESEETILPEKNIKILSIESPLLKDIKGLCQIKINDKDYRKSIGKHYEADRNIYLTTRVDSSNEGKLNFTLYDVKPIIKYEDEDGKPYYHRISNINYTTALHNLNFFNMARYLKERGAYSWR